MLASYPGLFPLVACELTLKAIMTRLIVNLRLATTKRVSLGASPLAFSSFAVTNEVSSWAGYEVMRYFSYRVQAPRCLGPGALGLALGLGNEKALRRDRRPMALEVP